MDSQNVRMLVGAMVLTFSIGVLYGWSIFLASLEHELAADRSTISLAPSLALMFFTTGAVFHDRGFRLLSARMFIAVSFLLAAAGHLVYALFPSVATLLVGYGIIFGFAAGLIYGIALFLAANSSADERIRSIAIGLTTASFALTGLVMSLVGAYFFSAFHSTQLQFGLIAAFQIVLGSLALLLVPQTTSPARNTEKRAGGDLKIEMSQLFIVLMASFFSVCFVGLMTVSHSAGLLADRGISQAFVLYAPLFVSVGYILGSVSGGIWASEISIAWSLSNVTVAAIIGTLALLLGNGPILLAVGIALLGASLGSSASVYPVVIGRKYGPKNIGAIYGKALIAYGLSGLIAPWLTGMLYVRTGGYQASLILALLLSFVGLLGILVFVRE